MVKLAIGFIAFAAIAIYVLMSTGGNIDLTGEKHGCLLYTSPSPRD